MSGHAETLHGGEAWLSAFVPVSAVLITYNHELYVEAALRSVLNQTHPLDIVVSDDASTDSTVEIIRGVLANYSGPHRIRMRVSPRNRGLVNNVNQSFSLAEGELIVLFEGDDISEPDRVALLVARYLAVDRRIGGLGSGITRMSAEGALQDEVIWPVTGATAGEVADGRWAVQGCTLAIRRSAWQQFGPITRSLKAADLALWWRAAFAEEGGLSFVPKALVRYRSHFTNVSSTFRLRFDSLAAMKSACTFLLPHEVAQVVEVKRMQRARPLSRMTDEQRAAFADLMRVSKKRARLVYAIAKKPRYQWIRPVIAALREPQLSGFAIRALSTGISPALRRMMRGSRR